MAEVQSRPSPGWVLSLIAVLCALLVLVPLIGVMTVLAEYRLLAPSAVLAIFKPPNLLVALMMLPTAILAAFAISYLIAFFLRASWGPRLLSALAVIWAVAIGTNTILVPMLTMPGGLPTLTMLTMVPGIIAPALFAIGFAGFLLQSETSRHWFLDPKFTAPDTESIDAS